MTTDVLGRDAAAEIDILTKPEQALSAPRFLELSFGRVRLELFRNSEELQESWSKLEQHVPCTCYQSYRWINAWQQHVSRPKDIEVAIAVGFSEQRDVLFILPFEVHEMVGQRVMKWLGEAHANYCFSPFAAETAAAFDEEDAYALLKAVAQQIGDVSGAILTKQPHEWDGMPNPFAKLPLRKSPNSGYAASLGTPFEEIAKERIGTRTRSTLRRKEKRIRSLASSNFVFCKSARNGQAVLDTHFEQKAIRLAEMGAHDPFEDSCHRAFYSEMAAGNAESGRLDMACLNVGNEAAATLGAIRHQKRTNLLLLSIADGEAKRWSPGLLLINESIRKECAAGSSQYDFGLGGGSHKDLWCNQKIELFDNFIAFRKRGLLITLPQSIVAGLKRLIKSNAVLWELASSARQYLWGRKPESED